jgi:two-component system, OmpR family, response regulator
MKVLVIEDDAETAVNVRDILIDHGYDVATSCSGPEGLKMARLGGYHALVVDRMLPGLDGLSLVKQLRDEANHVPVLFVTAMGGIDDRVAGLANGGDDYLCKPFALTELAARVNAIIRRAAKSEPAVLRVDDLELDLIRRTVNRAGNAISLQPMEFNLLAYLMRNAGSVVTRAMLLENVWALNFDPHTNLVETHMSRLRSKVDRGFEFEMIRTIRGNGYVLSPGT